MLKIDLSHSDQAMLSGHLRVGGKNPAGLEINANSRYLTLGGKPWLPVMGEIHYARCPRSFWRDELLKMKSGGVQIIASYIFWNYHEEIEGQFEWTGNRDLRAFVSLCGELGLYAYPRIGPWAHGEARLGGFPDWLVEKCGNETRRDAFPYLDYVRHLYAEIARQLNGLLWKDGGPIVGIQLENELYDQPIHLKTLKQLAIAAGMDVPLYTVTGWGPAQIPADEVIPVFGGYPDAFWERQHATWARDSRKHYFFEPLRDDSTIGADLRRSQNAPALDYLERYPFGTCELGGGMPPSYHRRPYISPGDVSANPFCKLGSGANLLGYYMYHGGTHAQGHTTSLQESQATGYWNDLAVRSYDFQAPLGEFGQVREHYHMLRLLHLFIQDFGSRLAPLPASFPEVQPRGIDDRETLRWAVRSDGEQGFLFANTYQRIESLANQKQVRFDLRLAKETLKLPADPVEIAAGLQLLWPVNLSLGGVILKYAAANLVCRLDDPEEPCFVFYAQKGIQPEFAFKKDQLKSCTGFDCTLFEEENLVVVRPNAPGPGCLLECIASFGSRCKILVLAPEDALRLWKIHIWGADRLVLSPSALLVDGDLLRLRSTNPNDLWFGVYPVPPQSLSAAEKSISPQRMGVFNRYQIQAAPLPIQVNSRKVSNAQPALPVSIGSQGVAQPPQDTAFEGAEVWAIHLPENILAGSVEVYLRIRYTGDIARAYLGGQLIADDFWNGRDWEIGLRRFAPEAIRQGLELRFLPLRKDAPIYIPTEFQPGFDQNGQVLTVKEISAVAEIEAGFYPA